jgi:uncharacterized protein (TIGR02594 family)
MGDQPAWLAAAWRELGTRETAGGGDNPRILAYFRDAGHGGITHDSTPWCAAFLGACLERSGLASTRSLLARSYLDYADACAPRYGAIAVLSRGSDPAAGHVGFLLGATGESVVLLGGNQGDAVSVASFPAADVLAFRWPKAATQADADAPAVAPLFETALAHVLEMEGGYDDDPADPGGPTNQGLTLADLAAARGVPLDQSTRAGLLAALKAIAPAEVRSIYHALYWLPSCAGELPAALALMHFDTAVNQGAGTAARMLQQAVGTDADGEIGPLTLAAAARADPMAALERYADLRRQRYRSLSGFARFGRGWLNRLDATLARARPLAPPIDKKENAPMASSTATQTSASPATGAESKWWGQSMTIWGTLITAAATVAPVVGPLIGIDISADTIKQLGGQTAEVARGIAGLVGTILAIYGRTRAVQPLMRREVALRL